ncbi:hypothetical protein BKA70DRAFT_1563680 [Coprinopsis sp. MPI-PUGE-AT-0042]|nr:hypothetical protein BKA70DRAFT_1563680 [Coprinopsis sp. MPI-PUGE-AT-0042]
MRFNIFIAASLLCTLASGLVVPSRLSERETDLDTRQFLTEDVVEFAVRAPGLWDKIKSKAGVPKNSYTVPAGGGKPAQAYSKQNVKTAVAAAQAEDKRQKAGLSKTQMKKSPLKPFSNSNHRVPLPGSAGPNSLPKVKGSGLKEFPLKHGAEAPGNKGPARVIVKPNIFGKLKFKGVVAHDQSRPAGSPGANDHFKIKGTNR